MEIRGARSEVRAVCRTLRGGASGLAPAARSLWLDLTPRPGAVNMAIDEALLQRAQRGEHWLRLYRWDPHCLSFGRHERAVSRYDRERIVALGLDVVRRPTGGRAVWHAGELTYAVAVPADQLGGLRSAYLEIHEIVRDALGSLGADATLADAPMAPGLDAGACFARPVGGEVLVRGRKVVGSAQLRQNGALLQHGSILLRDDQSVVGRVTRGDAPPDLAVPLERLLERPLPPAEVAEAVATAAAARWSGEWHRAAPEPEIFEAVGRVLPRYTSDAWTWRA